MRASSILSNSLLGACLVGQGLGVVLFDITQNIGATVMTYGEVRIYDGSVGDCGNENHPTTYCGTTGKLGGGQCTVNGSTGRINDYSAMGCSNAYDIHSGAITTPSGEIVHIESDGRCSKYAFCLDGYGGSNGNGWKCNI